MDFNSMTAEPNNCKHRCNGCCTIMNMVSCPSTIRCDDNNVNNMPCDGAGYKENENETD